MEARFSVHGALATHSVSGRDCLGKKEVIYNQRRCGAFFV